MALVQPAPAYPPAPRSDQVDDYFGRTIADPYRPLEELDAPATRAWIEAENTLTQAFLAGVGRRPAIRARLTELWNYERRSTPERVGNAYAYFRNTGLQNQAVLYVTRDLAEPGRPLLDPNVLSEDGTVALGAAEFSHDGARLAYSIQSSGSDWQEWRVRDVASGADLPDSVRWAKFSGAAWLHDGSGFFYSRYDEPEQSVDAFKEANYFHKVYLHRLGTPQSADRLFYERPDHKDWGFDSRVSDDGRYLVINVTRGTDPENRIVVADIATGAFTDLLPDGDASWGYVGNDGSSFVFSTTKDAPRGRIVSVDVQDRTQREIVPESGDVLAGASLFGERLIVSYLRDARARVAVFALGGGELREIELPGLGSVGGFGGRRDASETFYTYTSYTEPTSVYRYDLRTSTSTRIFTPQLPLDTAAFVSEQVFYASKDGTRIPMMLTYRKGTPRDGTAPTILYGYGGFDISLTPAFSTSAIVWCEMGGVYAVANLRGGGEYGEAWHKAGVKAHKQNVFDDFIAAGEWLIEQRYTSTPKLSISGGSNGGLLVGACLTQRPELFGAAVPAVGVLDMLRFDKFTIGWAWTSDYGSPEDPDDVATLLAYSPLHNVREGAAYPATLVTTGDHDDRVFPAHSLKFAAALQHAQGGDAPVLLRVDMKAGHGAGKPTAKLIDETADRFAFLVKVLGVDA